MSCPVHTSNADYAQVGDTTFCLTCLKEVLKKHREETYGIRDVQTCKMCRGSGVLGCMSGRCTDGEVCPSCEGSGVL